MPPQSDVEEAETSYDFMSGRTRDGASLRILNVVDEYTRVALGCRVDRSIGASDVRLELERLFEAHGRASGAALGQRARIHRRQLARLAGRAGRQDGVHREGSPQQNPFVERFNGTMRDELLNGEEFDSLLEARVLIEAWIEEYNTLRPHRGRSMMTPSQFAASWKAGSE